MKLPFRKDPTAALEKAIGERSAAELKLADLTWKRQTALVETDDLEQVQLLDSAIDEQRKVIGIWNERVVALESQCHQLAIEKAEKQKDEAIAALEKSFQKRHKLALELEAAVKVLGDAYFALLDSRQAAMDAWPSMLPRPSWETLRKNTLQKELAWALYAAGRPTAMTGTHLPAPSNAGLGVTGLSPKGIAGCIAVEQEAIIALLKGTPLPDEVGEQNEAA